jgi:hypothetical protein
MDVFEDAWTKGLTRMTPIAARIKTRKKFKSGESEGHAGRGEEILFVFSFSFLLLIRDFIRDDPC